MQIKKIFFLILLLSMEYVFSQANSDHIKIPFEIKNNSILLPVNFSNKVQFKLVFDSVEVNSFFTEQGILNFSREIHQNLYDWLRNDLMKKEPNISSSQLDERIRMVREGKRSLIKMNRMWCGDFWIYNEIFFDNHISKLSGDGIICLRSFKGIKNLIINCKDNFIEINGSLHEGTKVPMYKIENADMYCFYINCEIDGEKEPFVLATASPVVAVKSNVSVEEGESFVANIKIADFSQDFVIAKHNDATYPYNFLGFPFFKDKCVQFDFENMMLYVW